MPLPPDYFVARVLPAVGHAIFDFITTRDAAQVRACSVECRDAVAGHKWDDLETPILRDVPAWRACFPRATAAYLETSIDDTTWLRMPTLCTWRGCGSCT